MKALELAKKYLVIFFQTQKFDSLYDIFSENLDFEGPFFKSQKAKVYIDSLTESPWEACEYEILQEYGASNSACLIYKFRKGDKSTIMAQTFECSNGKIEKIRLIFNERDLT